MAYTYGYSGPSFWAAWLSRYFLHATARCLASSALRPHSQNFGPLAHVLPLPVVPPLPPHLLRGENRDPAGLGSVTCRISGGNKRFESESGNPRGVGLGGIVVHIRTVVRIPTPHASGLPCQKLVLWLFEPKVIGSCPRALVLEVPVCCLPRLASFGNFAVYGALGLQIVESRSYLHSFGPPGKHCLYTGEPQEWSVSSAKDVRLLPTLRTRGGVSSSGKKAKPR